MFHVGLDVHLRYTTVCILDDNGKVFKRHTARCIGEVIELLKQLPGPCQVCYEASTGYGFIFESLQPVAKHIAVAHPGLLRLIYRSKKKNDRADALKLAKLLYIDEVPTVHVPAAETRAWRELITFRRKLIEKRTRAKNGLRSLLRSLGIKAPPANKLWTKKGVLWLSELALDNSMHALKRDLLIEEVQSLSEKIRRVEKQLEHYAQESVAVQLLRTIPGVGIRTAEAVVAFIDDPHRFANSKRLGSYFGLVPMQDQSGSKNRLGHITREGSATVRQLLTEAVWQSVRRSPTVKEYLRRVMGDDPDRRKIAVVATAHYLVRVMWSMLKHNTVWRETVPLAA